MNENQRVGAPVMNVFIDAVSWETALQHLGDWASDSESRYVCICNVHSVVAAYQDEAFQTVLNHADMATPDGMPVAWALRRQGFAWQQRINGPDLMWKFCQEASINGQAVYFYGSTQKTLSMLEGKLKTYFPKLKIAGMYSPPFRMLSEDEDSTIVSRINASGAGVVFVSLGCPKQEYWMATHHGRIKAVMIGVGAAFDYHAGVIRRAPMWMQNIGLEWFYRLISEPRRLWRRYLTTNLMFIFKVGLPLLFSRPAISRK
jgi:N-acetylglucosaminyldiphosphoundecaprenol N-acetyl-beta-D-mannosaminyltransferase